MTDPLADAGDKVLDAYRRKADEMLKKMTDMGYGKGDIVDALSDPHNYLDCALESLDQPIPAEPPFSKTAADRLAYTVAMLIERGGLNARSAALDALLDYLNIGGIDGPRTVSEWVEKYLKRTQGDGIPSLSEIIDGDGDGDDSNSDNDEDILEEALRITRGDRNASYGPPDQDFERTARIWSAIKGVDFEAREVAMFMVALKLSRETHQRKRDNWVDIAGYARCGSLCR